MVLEHAGMIDFCGIPLVSLRENTITELDLKGKGVGVPGAIVLSKLLPSAAAVKSLKCAGAAQGFAFVSAPADTHLPSHCAPTPIPRSIGNNRIGAEGASALAAILKETMISNLKCAATR